MATLSIDTDLPVVGKDDLLPSPSDVSAEDRKPPAVVTPEKSLNNAPQTNDAGDTESETSVASSKEALDILFGKERKDEKPDPEGVTGKQAVKEQEEPTTQLPQKINRVSRTAANFNRPSTSAPRRTSAVTTGTGLSELSKQLRVLQAKNQYMNTEVERCQRQLKIMSESKGVSVVDVLKSLESACAKEAHAELQSQIEGLQAQLEMAGKSSPAVSKASQLEQDSWKQQIAALQLQVGNAEELETKYKEETKSLYAQVQTHQTKALTLESTVAQQGTFLVTERARTSDLEAEVKALREERDALKEKQTQRMADFWQHTLQKSYSIEEAEDWDGEVQKYMGFHKVPKDQADAICAPTDYPPQDRPTLQRTLSDPALWTMDPDVKAPITKSYVASMLPRYSSSYKQWTYDVADDTHRSKLYVKQSAKNMELEVLCRHQQQTLQELQQDHLKDKAHWERLEQERNVAQSRKNIFEQQVGSLELELRLEKEQAESLRGQLKRREEEFSLKKEQLQSRLQVGKERTVDLEGQLSSLYVAFELLQEDRSEEQTEQAELKMKLEQADTTVAQSMSEKPPPTTKDDEKMAQTLSRRFSEGDLMKDEDASESSFKSETASLRQRVGLLTPSPRRRSKLNLFSRSGSSASLRKEMPPPPIAASGRRASTNDLGKPPTKSQTKRRTSTGSLKFDAPPAPGVTVCKGFLMQLHSKKKKLFGDAGLTWKRKYMVLKRGEGSTGAGTWCIWWGDEPCAKVKGTIPHMVRGISTVSFSGSFTSDPDAKPYSFVIHVNPNDPKAPQIHLAAYSAVELEPWKRILESALELNVDEWSASDQRNAEDEMAIAVAKSYSY